ncbi:MAG: hypothetical protein HY903_24850 [Deltaproteobacteria bacterium]|nr:hypothetical protein [Deltaproteobacteria bacterium]
MLRAVIVSLALSVPTVATAASVYLNGVNIDGVTGQVFESCKVEIDANGNVFITAKGYAVQAPGGGAGAKPAPAGPATGAAGGAPTRHYYLVTEKAAPGMAQYDIDLFVNAKWVRKFMDSEEHVVMEITKFLVTGPNKVSFVAKKALGQARRSASPQHYFRIIVGEGNAGGRNVMITKKAVDYKRTALETRDFQDDFTLVAE